MSYYSPFLTEVLITEKGIPKNYTGFVVALPCLTYTLSCISINFVVKKIPRRVFVLLSFLMLGVSIFL
jgi:hypothetical protein